MKNLDYTARLLSLEEMKRKRELFREEGKKVVFTNGAFDFLHLGHLTYLTQAREYGEILIVGLNSDNSVSRYKGPERPIIPQEERALLLLGLRAVDYVVIFDEDEPLELIQSLLPDVLVKGADWAHYVSGREVVEKNGGKVVLAEIVAGHSSTSIINKIKSLGEDTNE